MIMWSTRAFVEFLNDFWREALVAFMAWSTTSDMIEIKPCERSNELG